MNIQTPGTADDFLAWNEGREGRREFVDGRVVEMMTGVSKNHSRIATNLILALGSVLDRQAFDFGTADYGVRTVSGVRYPDIYVERRGGTGKELATTTPIFLAEILSPSSHAVDFGPKVLEYLEIGSLRHYVVLSQDEPRVWTWRPGETEVSKPEILAGREASICLGAFEASLSLAEIYRGIA